MKTFYFLIAMMSFCLPNIRAAQPQAVKPVPVPKEMLDGSRLILKFAECSLDLPGPGFSWMTFGNADKIFLCLNAKTLDMYVVSFSTLKSEMTEHQPESLVKNARITTEARGGKISNVKVEMIDVPGAKKSARVSFQETVGGATKYAHIYLLQITDTTLLKLHITAPDKLKEPVELKKIVDSLKILKN